MALKVLMLKRTLDKKKAELSEAEERTKELERREAELETAIQEAETEEEQAAVEEKIEEFEGERDENEEEKSSLEETIRKIEEDIAAIEEKEPVQQPESPVERNFDYGTERGEGSGMEKRKKFFGMTMEQRDAFLAHEDVRGFLQRVREMKGQNRAVTGTELTVPEVMLDILRDNINRYSKLISKVNLKAIKGKARQNVAGTIPEGVWTEMVATLNELSITFNQIEMDGYKVGGYISIPNSTLDDSDLNLAAEIMDAIGQAIGFALDKAIIYGKGTKMPLGIVTRLAQTAKPENWSANAPEWKDISATNIIKTSSATLAGDKLFSELILDAATAKANYSTGEKWWAMNETTWAKLQSKLVTFNASGAVVSSMNQTMPIIGGDIVLLNFIPDGDIIGGYGSLYLLVEREGISLMSSEHVKFIEDMTIYKGIARYDGAPVLGQGFVAININAKAVTTSMDFAEDKANTPEPAPVE